MIAREKIREYSIIYLKKSYRNREGLRKCL